jgi:hypothetical protein
MPMIYININIDDLPLHPSAERNTRSLALAQVGDWDGFKAEWFEGGNPDVVGAYLRLKGLWADMRYDLGLSTDPPADAAPE